MSADFNPRPPRGGRRPARSGSQGPYQFQSTPPARGATQRDIVIGTVGIISIHAPREGGDCGLWMFRNIQCNFNPRPPRGGRLHTILQRTCSTTDFNPRPPRGGRQKPNTRYQEGNQFQSTPPARGATKTRVKTKQITRISIHAPREGGDWGFPYISYAKCHFNPRPPRGGRP